MTQVTLKLTLEELELLTNLASDQLFHREFIDPRIPGHKSNSEEMKLAKSLVGRLKSLVDPEFAKRLPLPRIAG